MHDSPTSTFSPTPTAALEEIVAHAEVCLLDLKNMVTGAEATQGTPAFCRSSEIEGVDGLLGEVTITLRISAERSVVSATRTIGE